MYPDSYIVYLVHFHGDRDYFECHEILEEYWKETDNRNKHSVWVGLILIAVSSYHHRRGNFNGAVKTIKKGIEILNQNTSIIKQLGLDSSELFALLEVEHKRICQYEEFRPYSLPFTDNTLKEHCKRIVNEQNMTWESKDKDSNEIIHRHITRDRSQVLKERADSIKKRMQ